MKKVRVSLYFGRSFDKNGTAPLCIAVNHASSSCYIPMPGVRLKREQWDKVRKRVINHPQADTINSVAASIDVPIEVISQALGHTYGMAVTLGYIMPDRRKVDEANSKVLGEVLKM